MITKPKFFDHLKLCMTKDAAVRDQVLSLMEILGYLHLRIVKRRSKSKFLVCFLKQIKNNMLGLV